MSSTPIRRTPSCGVKPYEPSIDQRVDGDNEHSQPDLNAVSQPCRIDDGHEVVLDEAIGVAGLTCLCPKLIFEIREGADAASRFYKKCPGSRR